MISPTRSHVAYALCVMLNHLRQGSGEPLLLIHPLGGTLAVWRPVIALLAAARDVIAIDLPGFGATPELADGRRASPVALAEASIDFCEELGISRPHIAGNSFGGWVALEMAKVGAARSVTVISPAGLWREPLGPGRRDAQELGRRFRPAVRMLLRTSAGRRLLLRGGIVHPERVAATDARAIVDGYLDAPGYAEANREMRLGVFEHDDRIQVPVTIVWGQRDRVVGRPSRSRRPPGARYVEMPEWGHLPMWDDPEGVARLLLEASGGPTGAAATERSAAS